MRYFQVVLALMMVSLLAVASYFLFRSAMPLDEPEGELAPALVPGQQEVVWLMPATSNEDWTRLITAIQQSFAETGPLGKLQPSIVSDFSRAFPPRSGEFPEIVLKLAGDVPQHVLIRWYKVGGQATAPRWIEKLHARGQPPLAIVGGDTSNRALETARALQHFREHWQGLAPLFLMTTATADRYLEAPTTGDNPDRDTLPKLIEVYKGRTFRFGFTNSRMVRGVLEFVKQTPTLWRHDSTDPRAWGAIVASGNPWVTFSGLYATGHFWPYSLVSLTWQDDRYSRDMAEEFLEEFLEDYRGQDPLTVNVSNEEVRYSAGDFFQPNPREQAAIDGLLHRENFFRQQNTLLVLPTGVQRVRRFLRGLCRQAPLETRNVLVLSGDSISFNSLYRDRDTAWNVLDLPVSLIIFTHRNPIDVSAGFKALGEERYSPNSTSTSEILLYRDLIWALVEGLHPRQFAMDADQVRDHLWQLLWQNEVIGPTPFFDVEGNRAIGTGEHIVWLRPTFIGDRIQPKSTISVWTREAGDDLFSWRRVGILPDVQYNRFGGVE